MLIGESIREIRTDHGLSQKKFADSISVSTSLVSQMESGKVSIMERTVSVICNKYGVNRDWLLHRNGNKYDEDSIVATLKSALCDVPYVYETAKLSSTHMSKDDWQMVNEFLKEMEEA